MLKTLDRYLIKEMAASFSLSIFVLTFLILIHQLFRLMELVIDKGIDGISIARIFLYLLPSFFLVTLPMAMMFTSVTIFHRLSLDNEIIALKSLGVGIRRLMYPVFFFSLSVALFTLTMGLIANPWGGASFKSLALNLLKRSAVVALEEGRFNGVFENMVIYVESMPTFTEMDGVFIYDARKPDMPVLITAQKGILTTNQESHAIELRLKDGSLHRKTENSPNHHRMTFSTYDFKIEYASYMQGATHNMDTPSYREVKRRIETSHGKDMRLLRQLSGFHKNFSFSLASFVFGMVGIPLGILSGKLGRSGGFIAGLGVILSYYMLNVFGDFLLSAQIAPPFLSAWIPHLVLVPFSVYLLIATAMELRLRPFQFTKK